MSDWPESQGRSLDEALNTAWWYGGGLFVYWLTPHTPWWGRLVQVVVFAASVYGVRRLVAWRRRARGTYWAEVCKDGVTIQVESTDPKPVEDAVRRLWGEQTGDHG